MYKITLEDTRDFLIWREGSGHTVEIYDIVVGSERRKGKGRRLVQQLFLDTSADYNKVWAITRADNFIAQQFYEALGFMIVGNLREFYSNRRLIDAIMYGRSLSGPI